MKIARSTLIRFFSNATGYALAGVFLLSAIGKIVTPQLATVVSMIAVASAVSE